MGELMVFLDDLEELHFYGDAWIAWVNPRSSWAVASITEPFGLSWGSFKCPLQKCDGHLFFFKTGFLYFSLLLFNIVPEKSCQMKRKQMVEYFD